MLSRGQCFFWNGIQGERFNFILLILWDLSFIKSFYNSEKEIEEFDLYMHAYSFYYTKRLMKAATVFQLKKIVLRNVHAIESCLMHRGLKGEGGIRNKYGIRNAEVSCLNLNNINLNYSWIVYGPRKHTSTHVLIFFRSIC